MQVHNVAQGTPEWLQLRLGKFTASCAQAIASNGKGLETLVYEKAAEVLTQKLPEQYTNADIDRGHELEAMARNSYELETGNVVKEVGFVALDEYVGASPDGMVGEDGLVEFKCPNNKVFVQSLYLRTIDPGYEWQMQMQMHVTGREWVDYVQFNPNFPKPLIITRVARDEVKISKIKLGLTAAVANLKRILERVQWQTKTN